MRKKTHLGQRLLCALVLFWAAAPAVAQVRILPAASQPARGRIAAAELDGILRRANQFETERRWGEAMGIYEEALRDHPDEPTLGDRHNVAKIHYDLGRRYNDSSFLRALNTLPDRQAINL